MSTVQRHIHRIQRQWRAALQAGSLILLLALLPMVGYAGHWGEFTDYAVGRAGREAPAHIDHAKHAGHCHGNSSCSDQQQPIGVRVFPAVVELTTPAFIDLVVEDDVMVMSGHFSIPPTEPPRL